MKKIELAEGFKEFEIGGTIFKIDLSNEACIKRGEAFGEIYDDIIYAENTEDLLLLYEKGFTALFGKDGFRHIFSLCEKNLYIMADLMFKLSMELKEVSV